MTTYEIIKKIISLLLNPPFNGVYNFVEGDISKTNLKALKSISTVSDKIIITSIIGKFNSGMFDIYTPTTKISDIDKIHLLEDILEILSKSEK